MKKPSLIFTCLVFGLIVCVANAVDLTSGLVGHWPLDGNAKAEVSGKDGKLVGGAEWVNDGKIKGAVKLNGTTGFVEVSGFSLTTTTITCVAWIKGWRQDAWTGIVASRGGKDAAIAVEGLAGGDGKGVSIEAFRRHRR